MALITCKECGCQISDKAEFCIHCGVLIGIPSGEVPVVRKLRYENGDIYEGEVVNNMRHGQGTYIWPDGLRYCGSFANNKRHGPGKYIDQCGEEECQVWEDDILIESSSQ